jgi:hypothetical protein
MLRKLAVLVAAATISLSFGVVGNAVSGPSAVHAAAGGNSSVQYCRSISQFYPAGQQQGMLGGCTSYFQQNSNATIASTYEYFCKEFLVPIGAFATQGQCVSYMIATFG